MATKLVVGYSSPFKRRQQQSSPIKMLPMAVAALSAIPGLITAGSTLIGRKKRIQEQADAKAELEKAKQDYMNMEFKNYYKDIKNPYAENLAEDLTVDQAGADYQKRMSDQNLANIGQTLKGAAGSSGISGLAQTMANISNKNAKEASLQIREQERANKKLQLEGEDKKRKGEYNVELLRKQGEAAKDTKEQGRTETMYELGLDRAMAADKARMAARRQLTEGIGQAAEGAVGGYLGARGVGGEDTHPTDGWEKDPDGNWVKKSV